jgi:DNA adenine methylase
MYVEPFAGGGAIFFAKEPAPCGVINDTNGEMVNFYEVLKRDFTALQAEIEISLHSRERHRQAEVVYNNPPCSTA